MSARRLLLAVLIAAGCLAADAAQNRTVAITFDDLPGAGALTAAEAEDANHRILTALKEYGVPSTGFVIDQRGQDLGPAAFGRILKAWLDGGHDLGNHTYSHQDFNDLSLAQFEEEVTRGESTIAKLLAERGRKLRYLRFPFNHTGDTPEKLSGAANLLRERGYDLATCTIENSDYEFARAYDLMLTRKANSDAARLREAYLKFTAAEIDYFTGLHRRIFGQETPHVMLLHVNRLNRDVTGSVLELFKERGYRFVTLETAQSDPAYRTPITRPTKYGPMWAYRWAWEKGVKVDGKLEPEPPAWVLQYGGK